MTNALAGFHIVTHCYVAPFPEKPFYVKLKTFSTSYRTKNETKLIADSKSTSTINMRSPRTVSQILLMSAVICI